MMINLWAVLSATIAAYLAGALWYSPLLFSQRTRRKTASRPFVSLASQQTAWTYGLTFLATLISAVTLHLLLGPTPPLPQALLTSGLIAIGLVACSTGITCQPDSQGLRCWLIDGGCHCVRFVLMGLVLALWPQGQPTLLAH